MTVGRPERRTATVDRMVRSFRVNLTALGLIALLVGTYFVYSTLSISVLQAPVRHRDGPRARRFGALCLPRLPRRGGRPRRPRKPPRPRPRGRDGEGGARRRRRDGDGLLPPPGRPVARPRAAGPGDGVPRRSPHLHPLRPRSRPRGGPRRPGLDVPARLRGGVAEKGRQAARDRRRPPPPPRRSRHAARPGRRPPPLRLRGRIPGRRRRLAPRPPRRHDRRPARRPARRPHPWRGGTDRPREPDREPLADGRRRGGPLDGDLDDGRRRGDGRLLPRHRRRLGLADAEGRPLRRPRGRAVAACARKAPRGGRHAPGAGPRRRLRRPLPLLRGDAGRRPLHRRVRPLRPRRGARKPADGRRERDASGARSRPLPGRGGRLGALRGEVRRPAGDLVTLPAVDGPVDRPCRRRLPRLLERSRDGHDRPHPLLPPLPDGRRGEPRAAARPRRIARGRAPPRPRRGPRAVSRSASRRTPRSATRPSPSSTGRSR